MNSLWCKLNLRLWNFFSWRDETTQRIYLTNNIERCVIDKYDMTQDKRYNRYSNFYGWTSWTEYDPRVRRENFNFSCWCVTHRQIDYAFWTFKQSKRFNVEKKHVMVVMVSKIRNHLLDFSVLYFPNPFS